MDQLSNVCVIHYNFKSLNTYVVKNVLVGGGGATPKNTSVKVTHNNNGRKCRQCRLCIYIYIYIDIYIYIYIYIYV